MELKFASTNKDNIIDFKFTPIAFSAQVTLELEKMLESSVDPKIKELLTALLPTARMNYTLSATVQLEVDKNELLRMIVKEKTEQELKEKADPELNKKEKGKYQKMLDRLDENICP